MYLASSPDTVAPEITNCPESFSYSIPPTMSAGRVTTWTEPTATDNSGQIPIVFRSHDPGDLFPVGTTQITYRFTDQAGNMATCIFAITIGNLN